MVAHARRAARHDRDVHAQAVHRPDRQRLPLPHVALARRREPVPATTDDPRGLGLSELAYRFIGGLKAHARAYSALTAPTVNSYKRLKLGATDERRDLGAASGSRYGYNNRTQMLRIPAPGRIEDRTIDGSANPYLAATGVLAAGLDGIEHELDAGDPNSTNLYELESTSAKHARDRRCCRRTCSTRSASSSATTCCGKRSAQDAVRGLPRLLRRASSGTSGSATRAGHRLGARSLPAAVLILKGQFVWMYRAPSVAASVRCAGRHPIQQRPRRIHAVRSRERQREARKRRAAPTGWRAGRWGHRRRPPGRRRHRPDEPTGASSESGVPPGLQS